MKIQRLALPLLVIPFQLSAQYRTDKYKSGDPRTITVSGEAVVTAAPDYVTIHLKAVSENVSLLAAKQDNDRRINKAMAIAKSYQLKPEDTQMEYASIDRDFSSADKGGVQRLLGYTITKRVNLTCRDLSRFEPMLNELLSAGINELENVEFRSSQSRKLEDQARELAITAAQEKAVALAAKLGQKVGKPLNIEEQYSPNRVLGYAAFSANRVLRATSESSPAPESSAGLMNFSARVSVTFELE